MNAPQNAGGWAAPAPPMQVDHSTGHRDHVHDVQLNWTGKRMATCSSDRCIRIWDLGGADGGFVLTGEIKGAHQASIIRLSWANPFYGQIIASCGFDRYVKVWQETLQRKEGEFPTWKTLTSVAPGISGSGGEGVHAIEFAPRQHGLKLAVANGEGSVTVFSACGADNEQWDAETFSVGPRGVKSQAGQQVPRCAVTCLSWNPSCVEDREMLVLGNELGQVMIFAAGTVGVEPAQPGRSGWAEVPVMHQVGQRDALQGLHNQASPLDHPKEGYVADVAWGPSLGRSYELIASCSRLDGMVRICRLVATDPELAAPVGPAAGQRIMFQAQVLFQKTPHEGNSVWRLSWNATGTTLATSGDDGLVRLWQQDSRQPNEWSEVNRLEPEEVAMAERDQQ